MAIEYLNERIDRRVIKRLRKFERKNRLEPSISKTTDFLLEKAELIYPDKYKHSVY
jgi:phosphoglycerate-specific signal transduction histidine kinase